MNTGFVKRTFSILSLGASTAALSGSLVLAQTRIADLERDRSITISGQVISVVGNVFSLNDGTGEIIVDAGPRWWQEINLSPGERVTVTGELGKKGEFDAFNIRRSNGSTIEIRSPNGPPPWAGGPRRNRLPENRQ